LIHCYDRTIIHESVKQAVTHIPGPVFTKIFTIRIKIRLKLKSLILWFFLKPTIII